MFRRWIVGLALLGVVACEEFPTEAPIWEQTWAVPGEDFVVTTDEVVPPGVSVSPDGTTFEADVLGTDLSFSVGEMCGECQALHGTTAPKPAFSYTVGSSTTLPPELVSASLVGDQFDLRLAHNLSFDPLRPDADAGAERGYLLIEITSDGAVIARDSISGDDVVFDSTVVLTRVLPVQPVDVSGTFDVGVTIYSPAGDDVLIDASDTVGISLQPTTVAVSEATIAASGITLDADAAQLDFTGIDSALVSRIQSGTLRLEITNDFGLEGNIDLAFDVGTGVIERSLPLATGASVVVIDLSRDEIRDLLDAGTVDVTAGGTLSAPDGTITITPADSLVMRPRFEIVILVGGEVES